MSQKMLIFELKWREKLVSETTIRDLFVEREKTTLSEFAFLTSETKGREHPYTPCSVRTEFQRDRDKIIHSNSFRRLMHKTQVFLAPVDDHYRTRLTHTLEVSQIARIIARALRLNEDLTEAAALGHDLGHTPLVTRERMLCVPALIPNLPIISRACESLKSWRMTVRGLTLHGR